MGPEAPATRRAPAGAPPEVAAAVLSLRHYLDSVAFGELYKFIVGPDKFFLSPAVLGEATHGAVEDFFRTALQDRDLGILRCLMLGRRVAESSLSEFERPIAEALVEGGLLERHDRHLVSPRWQLISCHGLDLLIDRRLHFAASKVHDVYIGVDTYLMLYYLRTPAIRRDHRSLDLCTGSGVSALYLSLFCDHVVATDISPQALELVHLNRLLNDREEVVEIRNEELSFTLERGERFDWLTCNPPFVAFPENVEGSLYAAGPGVDGLGYLRTILDHLPKVLKPGGQAFLVSDLVGDDQGPHLRSELASQAQHRDLEIDLYIDHRLSAETQVAALSSHIQSLNPNKRRDEIEAAVVEMQRDRLHADYYYLSTIRVRTGARQPGLRSFYRYDKPQFRREWPEILLAV